MRDVRNFYIHGKHAIIQNLPWPPVSVVGDVGHVSLKDCVVDLLGNEFIIDSMDDVFYLIL